MTAWRSLEFRLTAWYSAMLLLGYVIFGLALWLTVRYAVSRAVDALLLDRIERLVNAVSSDADGPEEVEEELVEYILALPESHLAQFRDDEGNPIYPPEGAPTLPWSGRPGEPSFQTVHSEGVPYRTLTREITILGRSYSVLLASSLQSLSVVRDRLAASFLAAAPLALLLCSGGGLYIAHRALRPLERIAETASGITVGSLSRRIAVPPTGDVLERLARTFNEMLERLEASIARIEQFSADASHELRTPLSVIRTTAELALRHRRTEEDYRTDLKEIHDEAVRLSDLVEALLALSREGTSGNSVAISEVDLSAIASGVLRQFQREAESKGLSLRFEAPDHPVVLSGNEASLRRMIACLLENAIAHTREGGLTLSVREADSPELSVTDSGEGIPEEALGKIFDRFYRLDSSRSRATGSHGLGLAIAQRIAAHHGAEISVQSRLKEGSRFTVQFHRRKGGPP